jgi:hypothetical protein
MRRQTKFFKEFVRLFRLFLLITGLIGNTPAVVLAFQQPGSQSEAKEKPANPSEVQIEEEDRVIKIKQKDHPALEIKSIRNHRRKTWVRDLEIEVTNITKQSIYFIEIDLKFPEIILDGLPVSEDFTFGRRELIDWAERPKPEDVPLKPGESYTFKFSPIRQKIMEGFLKREGTHALKVEMIIAEVRFGDGSGFNRGQFFRTNTPRISLKQSGEWQNKLARKLQHQIVGKWEARPFVKKELAAGNSSASAEPESSYCWGSYCEGRYTLNNNAICHSSAQTGICYVTEAVYQGNGNTGICAIPRADGTKICYATEGGVNSCIKWMLEGCGQDAGTRLYGTPVEDVTPTPTPTPGACPDMQTNPHYVCYSDTQVCVEVRECGMKDFSNRANAL